MAQNPYVNMTPAHIPQRLSEPPEGLVQLEVLCFGMCDAPATFQIVMYGTSCDMFNMLVLVYLDDIIIFIGFKESPE